MTRFLLLLGLLGLGSGHLCAARNTVRIDLTVYPETHRFSCRYTLVATSPAASLALNLSRPLQVEAVSGAGLRDYSSRLFFDGFQKDTLRRLDLNFRRSQPQHTLTLQYNGALPARFYSDSLAEFTPWASWLPVIPDHEYDLVDYQLTVHVPAGYTVVGTKSPRRVRAGRYEFAGTAPAIEITALAARRFTRLASAGDGPAVVLYKANRPTTLLDTLLLDRAGQVIAFENQIIGRQDPIRQFTFLLPGTNRNAGGLTENAADITYSDFDVRKPGELYILAHEISHKWWGAGTWNNYDNWLNEGFASYTGLLYLRAVGDTASFRQGIAQRRKAAAQAPAILGIDLQQTTYATFRQVMYDKPTVILYELHQRLGDAAFYRLLTATAAARVATTAAFLDLVERESGRATRQWLTQQLSQ